MSRNEKYLGNPLILNRDKPLSFEGLVNKVKNKINMWKGPSLFQAGTSPLIRHVASAIPLYNMAVLKLSTKIINQIKPGVRRFWWGDQERQSETSYYHVRTYL